MSEKELREAIESVLERENIRDHFVDKALAKGPDLVRVADWLLDLAAGEELMNRDSHHLIRNTLRAAAEQLQRDFGFRLIKGVKGGGWEWTER